MCGIVGFYGQGNQEILKQMTNRLAHRGPDDSGVYLDGPVGLGHRRLSIIDLSPAGHQPMISEDGQVVITFNGEIYNFEELKNDLIRRGYHFKSQSDTEVIIQLYREYGCDCFMRMNGMFALAIYDKNKQVIILARDRLGKKPLYWTIINRTLIFGSELKALMPHPLFKREIDCLSMQKYFVFDYIPTPNSIYKNVFKLEPGSYLIFNSTEIKKRVFWDISFKVDTASEELNKRKSLEAVIEEMHKRLEAAVVNRLVSDVPLGIFLSGGLDSSTIAYFAQKKSLTKIKTFSIGFSEKSFDESNYARKVAKFLNTEHYEKILSAQEALNLIPLLGNFIDEPVADYSFIPTFLLSQFTREQVIVALGGDGGDELFLGYPTFLAEKAIDFFNYFPSTSFKILKIIKDLISVEHTNFNFGFKLEKFLAGTAAAPAHRHHLWLGTFSPQQLPRLLLPEWRDAFKDDDLFANIDNYVSLVARDNRYHQLVYLYLKTYLMDQVLVKVDRMSMANSLEVRAPFLDYQFVDFVNSLDISFKMNGWSTKYLLRALMRKKLPEEIVKRKKQGFGVPLATWFNHELKPFVLETLSEDKIRKQGYFDYYFVKNLLNEHFFQRKDNRKQIWSLLIWQMWHEKWQNRF